MKRYFKVLFYGFLSWFVPFFIAIFFYTKDGDLRIEEGFFKSIMVIVGAMTGAIFLSFYFKKLPSHYFRQGFLVGLAWLMINLLLDFGILLPMSQMPLDIYLSQIGLRYLTIPIMSTTIGYILERHEKRLGKTERR